MPDMTNPRWWMDPAPFGGGHRSLLWRARQDVMEWERQWVSSLQALAGFAHIASENGYDRLPHEEIIGHLKQRIGWADDAGQKLEKAREKLERREREQAAQAHVEAAASSDPILTEPR
jgi:hypothetical protein